MISLSIAPYSFRFFNPGWSTAYDVLIKGETMNFQKMMKQAAKMQEQITESLAKKTAEASVGGGKVKVVANGLGEVISIKISPEVVDPNDVEMLEDLILSGIKQAAEDGKAMAQNEMGQMTKDLGLPPGF
jgi:nucleoid-associated protein EbfC